jgi:APA family basic amino acid/polyamine antiporter
MNPQQHETPRYTLKRDLGIWSAAAIVVGTVIGSGIFMVPHDMIGSVGRPSILFCVWIAGGLLSLFGALSYAELSAALPEAGGEYVYLREAYGPFWAFVYGWTQMWVAKSGSIATLASGFVERALADLIPQVRTVCAVVPLPIGKDGKPLEITYGQLVAIGLIVVLATVNYYGVKVGGNVQVAMTIAKVGMIAAIIVIGLLPWNGSMANYGTSYTPAGGATIGGIAGFFAALVAALWAYDGWNNVSMVSSEVRNPQRNLPRALIIGTSAVVGLYLLANLAYFHVLPAATVGAEKAVAGATMRAVFGEWGGHAASIVVMISIFGALNGSILSGSRVPYAMARDGLFFRPVAEIHPKHRTPHVSILALSAWGALLVLSGKYNQLFTYVIFASVILYGMATASVIVLRYKRPDLPRPYRTLGYPFVPVLFVAAIACLIVSTLMESPRESLMGLGIIALGVPFYFYWSRKSRRTAGN